MRKLTLELKDGSMKKNIENKQRHKHSGSLLHTYQELIFKGAHGKLVLTFFLSLISKEKISKDHFITDKPTRSMLSLISKVNQVHEEFLIQSKFKEIHIEKCGSPESENIPL